MDSNVDFTTAVAFPEGRNVIVHRETILCLGGWRAQNVPERAENDRTAGLNVPGWVIETGESPAEPNVSSN